MNRVQKLHIVKSKSIQLYEILCQFTPSLVSNPDLATDKDISFYNSGITLFFGSDHELCNSLFF